MSDNDLEILHTTKFIYTFDEYKKGVFATPTKLRRIYDAVVPAICFSFGMWLFSLGFSANFSQIILWCFTFLVLACFILRTIRETSEARKGYSSKVLLQELTVDYTFLAENMELRSSTANRKDDNGKVSKFRYNNFVEIIETRTNFYLIVNELGEEAMFIILKENCTPELVEFIRNLPVKKRYQRK